MFYENQKSKNQPKNKPKKNGNKRTSQLKTQEYDEVQFDFSFKNPYGENKIDNELLLHAEDTFPILNKINEKEIPMFSDAYALLANTAERFYKGVFQELVKLYPNDNDFKLEHDLNSHRFYYLIPTINKKIQLANSKNGFSSLIESCKKLHMGYTDSKYKEIYTYSQFATDFLRFSGQRKRIYEELEKLMELEKEKQYEPEEREL